ncbi:hypothetical protein AZE42_06189 [Rhizopogon vesiculosus]|uniref:Tetrapyrrole methylase domain-containing protein n=1 Tax=Rhizopogon vesiculosus TaxID=180088 RepID=A0A1J8PPK6_9AGAM|nr:hypothetical protein AZE42_06189 [Rhizopogon vesiculosus]
MDTRLYTAALRKVLCSLACGIELLVGPGVSSGLAAPIFTGIPVTTHIVVGSVVVCTGVGRQGKDSKLPGYESTRTVFILMGVARIAQVVSAMISDEDDTTWVTREGIDPGWAEDSIFFSIAS